MKLIAQTPEDTRPAARMIQKSWLWQTTLTRWPCRSTVCSASTCTSKFTDGRAYSQAFLLRRRRGFAGEIRATGDVLIDQLVQMQRTGFDVAVLRADQDVSLAQRQFDRYSAFYQGDAVHTAPLFATGSAA